MSADPELGTAQPAVAGGVLEIAALTALLGSSTAEALILGNRGASGIVWASLSIFGIYAVIKGCVGAATPNWLRETVGVRNDTIDHVIGSAFDLSKKNIRARIKLGSAVGIQSEVKSV
jgi:hypothetical protein